MVAWKRKLILQLLKVALQDPTGPCAWATWSLLYLCMSALELRPFWEFAGKDTSREKNAYVSKSCT